MTTETQDEALKLTIELAMSQAEGATVASRLGIEPTRLNEELKRLFTAAALEYLGHITGERLAQTGSDFRQQRLLLLILHYYQGVIPGESTVCRLFQVTPSGARALIRNVVARYSCELEQYMRQTLKDQLENARVDDDVLLVSLSSSALCEELNRILEAKGTGCPPVVRRRDSVSLYQLERSSYSQLCEDLKAKSVVPDGA